jgi:predicted nucleic acid-binding protein
LILLDTSVLSLAFRRRERRGSDEPDAASELTRMIEEDWPLAVPGIVLQELLSGVRSASELERLRGLVDGFPLITATIAHHLAATELANSCRAKGIAAGAVDCLIAAQTIVTGSTLFTFDQDFVRIASCSQLALWSRAEQ